MAALAERDGICTVGGMNQHAASSLSDTLVSVILPTHDRADMILRAVDSALGQTHRALEIIIIDDGSTDDTMARLADRPDPRIRILTHAVCRGVSAARNTGLTVTRGAYVALLDSDDEWMPSKVERQLAFMRERDLVISQTQEIWMRGGRRVNPTAVHRKPDGFFFEESLERCLVSPSTVMCTRAFFDEIGGFDESLPACEDYDLWLRAMVRYPVGLLDVFLTVRHGGRGDQLSTAYVGQDLFRIRSMARLLQQPEISDWHKKCIEKELRRKTKLYVQGCLKRDRSDEAMRVLALVEAAIGSQKSADASRPEPAPATSILADDASRGLKG